MNCPPTEPIYIAVRALIWLGQIVGLVGRQMRPLELERVYAATVSVPITDRYASVTVPQLIAGLWSMCTLVRLVVSQDSKAGVF